MKSFASTRGLRIGSRPALRSHPLVGRTVASATTPAAHPAAAVSWQMVSPIDMAKRRLSLSTDRIRALPVVELTPHGRCDCRCVMCDVWKADEHHRELSEADLSSHLDSFKRLRVRRVILSGGEALMHSNLWRLCEMLRALRIKITLITSGQRLADCAPQVAEWCDDVIVSLDGTPRVHDRVRSVNGAYGRLRLGVLALRSEAPKMRVTARSVLQQMNYFDVGGIIDTARELPVDGVNFVAVDVSSDAFRRAVPWEGIGRVMLRPEEIKHFDLVVEAVLRSHWDEIASGFVVQTAEEIRGFVRYFRALNDEDSFPEPVCNAPWVSAVLEADGSVRPCPFHPAVGNINEAPLEDVINGPRAARFREELEMSENPTCRRCVSKLHLTPYQRP
jgi:MoaA/NifB/PqqE/SkfB family radical SAM enzyme